MTPSDIQQVIQGAYQRVTGRTSESLSREADIRALGLDSVQVLEMIVIAERELGLRVPDAALGGLDTLGDLRDALEKALKTLQPAPGQA
jgi:acyl carrier protein